jgi:serine/threonine protein phosphatase PrpC
MGNSQSEQTFSTGHYGAQGIRPTMEDSVVMLESFGEPKFQNQAFFAVFDGHNGDRCSEFLG